MKVIGIVLVVIAWALFVFAGFATPVCIVYAIYSWGVSEVAFQSAAGAAVILWIKMSLCVIPGFIFFCVGSALD